MPNFKPVRWLASIVPRDKTRIRRDVNDEIGVHIDMRAEALQRNGMSPADARAQAEREFGDAEDAATYCADISHGIERKRRITDWFAELGQDATHAARLLVRGRAFAIATIGVLGCAIGTSTAVYGVLHTYIYRALPFPDSDRIMAITLPRPADRNVRGPSTQKVDWRTTDSLFAASAYVDVDGFTLLGGSNAENIDGAWVTPGFFDVLRVTPAFGRSFSANEYQQQAPVALISHGLWMRRFGGDSSVVGSTVRMFPLDRATMAVAVVGVLPADFWPMYAPNSEILLPVRTPGDMMPWMVRVRDDIPVRDVEQRLDAIVRGQMDNPLDPSWHVTLAPALQQFSAPVQQPLKAVLGAAVFMFLAACASVAGALVSRMASRRGELALRLALGGSRTRIVRQLLTESAVMSILAGVLGVAIAYVLLTSGGTLVQQQLRATTPGGVAALRPTGALIALSLVLSAVVGVVLGLIPALTFLRSRGAEAGSPLAGAGRGSVSGQSGRMVRRVLIAGQLAVAAVLAFGSGLMFRSIARMNALELGFAPDGVIKGSMFLPQTMYRDSTEKRMLMDRVLDRLSGAAGVQTAAAAFPYPFRGGGGGRFPVFAEGSDGKEETAPRAGVNTVSSGYFATMGIEVVRGRTFTASDDHAAPLVAIVSERLARQLSADGNPVGKSIRVRVPYAANFNDRDNMPLRSIIGVVSDVRKTFLPNESPDVFVPYAQNPRSYISIVVRTDRADSRMVDSLRRLVAGVDPALALSELEPLSDAIERQGGPRRGLTVLLSGFAAFAMALSALGLYASLAYTVIQRRSEFAIRMAIGANASSIVGVILREALATATIGIAIGVAASLALGRVLTNQVYGIGTGDPLTLVAISVILAIAALAACVVPGLRAARTDPMLALRE